MPTVVICPKCQHKIVVMNPQPGATERCGRCGGAVAVPGGVGAGGGNRPTPAAVARAPLPQARPIAEPGWSSVRFGLRLVQAGVRTYLFAGLLAVAGLALWAFAREQMPGEIPLGGILLGTIFSAPAILAVFVASFLVAAGRIACLGIPASAGIRIPVALAAAGAILTLGFDFVAPMVVLRPIVPVVHLVSEVAFLFVLAGIGAAFGDGVLAANAKRFLVFAIVGGSVVIGASLGAASLIASETAAVPSGATGLVLGLLAGWGLMQWFRWFEEPRIRMAGLAFLPGALIWAGGLTGIYTSLLGIVGSVTAVFLIRHYLELISEAISCIPSKE